ncbi:Transmembrane protein 19 [Pleurostoma richardsiae]|uniref:Transmembrane protein 19 n=1 Tax=Pleurostoma richardsiae TaxID=41990 RepID=A0AA38VW66_9PEZI|nr:Transmembrane protein 19 [Pleurostoma richardsiae]
MKPIIAVPATLLLMYRAYSHKSLTPAGVAAAGLTAVAHAIHPWNLPFVLLSVFFLAGTRVTKIKKNVKAKLTIPSKGTSGGEGPRTHVQVFANSLVASVLSLLHAYQLHQRKLAIVKHHTIPSGAFCFSWGGDVLVIGIIANYAAVAADTFSSELGILARSQPRLITSPTLRKVPPGTNGGVTILGLFAGLVGSMLIVTASMFFIPLCDDNTAGKVGGGIAWTHSQRQVLMVGLTLWGLLGSVLDSVLGALFQRSVKDVRSGKIVEGEGGTRVLVSPSEGVGPSSGVEHSKRAEVMATLLHGEGKDAVENTDASVVDDEHDDDTDHAKYDPKDKHRKPSFGDEKPSRAVESGWDLLDNNDVNFLMALTMSLSAMVVAASYWGISPQDVLSP